MDRITVGEDRALIFSTARLPGALRAFAVKPGFSAEQ